MFLRNTGNIAPSVEVKSGKHGARVTAVPVSAISATIPAPLTFLSHVAAACVGIRCGK